MNLVEWEFLLCEWLSFGLSACCFGSANRDDSFYGKSFDVSCSSFLIILKTRHSFTIWVRVLGYMPKTIR